LALADALAADPERMASVHVVSCPLPGMNETDYAGLHEAARLTVFLPGGDLRSSFTAGRVDVLPLSYGGIARFIAEGLAFDLAIAQVSPPGQDGLCSLGIASDFFAIGLGKCIHPVSAAASRLPDRRVSG